MRKLMYKKEMAQLPVPNQSFDCYIFLRQDSKRSERTILCKISQESCIHFNKCFSNFMIYDESKNNRFG